MHVRNIALITMILLSGRAIAQAPAPTVPSAIYADPTPDLAHPASTLAIEITSHGSVMNGMVYRPSGTGPFPLVVLMHGLPGNEQNLDLAQALRRAGWAVMTFHYRGSWGSEGQFSIDHVIEDANVALTHSADPQVAKAWNIDPMRIVVMGHSMGGLAAALTAGAGPKRVATVLLAPWDPTTLATLLRPLTRRQRNAQAMARWGNVTSGRLRGLSSPQIAAQIVDHGERWRLADAAQSLSEQPLLIVTAQRDLPSSQAGPLMTALRAAGAKYTAVEIASDHVFDDGRVELETTVINWLNVASISQFQGDVAAIKAARAASNRAIAAHDLISFLPMFTDDAVFTWSNGSHAIGEKDLASFFARDFADPKFNRYVRSPSTVSISDRGIRASEQGTWVALKKDTQYGGNYLAHWMKLADGWRVVGEVYVKLYCSGPLCTP